MEEQEFFNIAIKSFLDSALGVVGFFSSDSSDSMNCLADLTLCLRNLATQGKQYTDWDTLFNNTSRLVSFAAENRYYKRVYMAMNVVLSFLFQYYKASENIFKQQRLINAMKQYWIIFTRNPFRKIAYNIMCAERIVQRVSR